MSVSVATALATAGLALVPVGAAQADVVNATLVRTTWTGGPNSNWAHPSPDPSGVTYNSRTGKLIISDGEVEETGPNYPKNVWKGTNLFVANLDGSLAQTGLNTMAYSPEPTGVSFRPNLSSTFPERLFVSDDDAARVFEVNASDGIYGNSNDTQTSFSVSFLNLGPRADAEDVAVDLELTRDSQLLIVDGKGKRVFVYSPGPDRIFNGQAAEGGDDVVVRVIDVGNLGAGDPEGIAYNPHRNSMFVLDDPSNQIYEVGLDGALQNIIKLPFTMKSGAGIALAPPSSGSGPANAYIVDRGVDNDTNQDTFNDGRLYEVAIPGLTGNGGGGGGPTPGVVDIPVRVGSDDAEQRPNGSVLLGSGDLNLGKEDSASQTVGIRFTGVGIPRGATITNAYVQFEADEVKTGAASFRIAGQASDNPPTFTTATNNISSRPRTTAKVEWQNVAQWPTIGARTEAQRTPNLSTVVQEIVNDGNWASGDPLVLFVTGTGERAAESYNGGAAKAPVLHVEYTVP